MSPLCPPRYVLLYANDEYQQAELERELSRTNACDALSAAQGFTMTEQVTAIQSSDAPLSILSSYCLSKTVNREKDPSLLAKCHRGTPKLGG